MFWVLNQKYFFPLKWEPVWWSGFLVTCWLYICIWNGSGGTSTGFLTGWLSLYVFWHVCGPLWLWKNGCTLCCIPEPVRNNFFFPVMNLRSLSCVLSGTNTSRCGPLLMNFINRVIPQSLSWSRKAVVLSGALRRKGNLHKPQILSKIVSCTLPLPEKIGRERHMVIAFEGPSCKTFSSDWDSWKLSYRSKSLWHLVDLYKVKNYWSWVQTFNILLFVNLLVYCCFSGVNVIFACKSYLQCILSFFLEAYSTDVERCKYQCDIKRNNQETISREPYLHFSSKNQMYRIGPGFIDGI